MNTGVDGTYGPGYVIGGLGPRPRVYRHEGNRSSRPDRADNTRATIVAQTPQTASCQPKKAQVNDYPTNSPAESATTGPCRALTLRRGFVSSGSHNGPSPRRP